MPETRYEVVDGKVVYVPPADEPHGTCHTMLAALLQAHAASGYTVAIDMLTRTSKTGDMAPDASVFPTARDEATGGRRLEELAFEIVSTERLGHSAKKARALTARGVRRVFALDLAKHRTLEWSASADKWVELPADSVLTDAALAVPLPAAALVDTAKGDGAIAAALLARKHPLIEEALEEAAAAGEARGEAQAKLEERSTESSPRSQRSSPRDESASRKNSGPTSARSPRSTLLASTSGSIGPSRSPASKTCSADHRAPTAMLERAPP